MKTTRSWNLKAASMKCRSLSNMMFQSDLLAMGNEETLRIYRVMQYENIPVRNRRIAGILLFTAIYYGCSFPL